jgi:hypothetical protein
VMRSERGERASAISVSPIQAPADRASVSRSEVRPDDSATFATVPLTAKSVAAVRTMA